MILFRSSCLDRYEFQVILIIMLICKLVSLTGGDDDYDDDSNTDKDYDVR